MGEGLFIKCKDCEFENEYMFGEGFLFSSFESVMELLPHRQYTRAKEILDINQNTTQNFDGYDVYQCDSCSSVQNTFLIEIKDKDNQVLFTSIYQCSKCKKNRTKLHNQNGKLKDYRCPKCQSHNIDMGESMMWD